MKKLLLVIVVLLISKNSLLSQDRLIGLKNDTLLVKVMEITPKEIKYKLSDNQDGPLITVSKNEFVSIIYQNGTTQILQDAKALRKRIVYKNTINVDFMSFLTGEVEVNYDRLLKGNMISIQIPVRIGYPNTFLKPYTNLDDRNNYNYNYYYDYRDSKVNLSFRSGALVKFYYNKPGIVRGYSGIELIGGFVKSTITLNDNSGTGYYPSFDIKRTAGIVGFMAITGFKVTPYPRITLSVEGGGGYAGIFRKGGMIDINGTQFDTGSGKYGSGVWKVTTSIGFNF